MFAYLLNCLVDAVAYFISRILNHPSVQDAAANAIVAGAKKLCLEPDLDQHFQALSITLKQHQERDAQQAGHDFPKVLGSFVKGMIIPPTRAGASVRSSTTSVKQQQQQASEDSPLIVSDEDDGDDETSPMTSSPSRRSLLLLPDLRLSQRLDDHQQGKKKQ